MSAACLNVTPAAAGSRPAVAIIPHLLSDSDKMWAGKQPKRNTMRKDAKSPDDSGSIESNCYRAIETIERYGRQGFIVSVAFGPCGKYGEKYSVTVMDLTTGKEFYKPFGASSFADIAMILDIEVRAMLAR
jgi:hypothetical protein